MAKTSLSVVIPVKNAAESLPFVLTELDKKLTRLAYPSYEIVVVDRDSIDQTAEIVRKMASLISNLKLVLSENGESLGVSIKKGMLLASGAVRLLFSPRNLIDIEEFKKMEPQFLSGADVVFGARSWENNYKNLPRIALAKILNSIFRLAVIKNLEDPTSEFIAFKDQAAEKVWGSVNSGRPSYQFEVLKLAKQNDLNLKEVKVIIS